MILGGMLSWIKGMCKFLLDAMAMNHRKPMATPGSKGQESSHVETEKLDPQEHRESDPVLESVST